MSDASLAQPWSPPLIDMPGFAHYYATVTEVADVDIAVIADRYTTLTTLRLWGKPGMVSNMASLSRLAGLQMFTTVDLFGFSPDEFPAPPQSGMWNAGECQSLRG